MAAAATMAALKSVPAAMQMRAAMPAAKRNAPAAMSLVRQAMSQALPAATRSLAKSSPGNLALSRAMSSLSRAAPHLSAMTQGQGLVSSIFHGFKAVRALRGATRELSKMMTYGQSSTGKSGGGFQVMVGRPSKNWEEATAANGFRELGGKQTSTTGARTHGIRIMVGRPQKNWEEATAANGFRELGGRKKASGGNGSGGFRMMVGRVQKNWESPDFDHGRAHGGHSDMRIEIGFSRNKASSGLAEMRIGGLSISMHGAVAASLSRKRSNAFDDGRTRRKHASGHEAFPALASHGGGKARQRISHHSAGRDSSGLSMTIGF
jgi:hypothetical protein